MNASCTHCHTVYRVDPQKVTRGGVRARCAVCRGVFAVGAPAPVQVDEPAIAAAGSPGVAASAASVAEPPAAATGEGDAEIAKAALPASQAARPGAPRFGEQDPAAKARRLARALVSDIVTYHPERQQRALRDGSLRHEFREEIRKSWEEYVEQVGKDLAHGSPYFRDALNEILARGQPIF